MPRRPPRTARTAAASHPRPQRCGADAGAWCAEGQPSDCAPDQRAAEGLSLCFTSAPLAEPLEMLGLPRLDAPLRSRPATGAGRRPAGRRGAGRRLDARHAQVFNLAHRDEPRAARSASSPAASYDVASRSTRSPSRLPAGHRLRLALSPTYWPWAWPSPQNATLSVATGECPSSFPCGRRGRRTRTSPRSTRGGDVRRGLGEQYVGPFDERGAPDAGGRSYTPRPRRRRHLWDFRLPDGGVVRLPNGWESEDRNTVCYGIREGDPLSAARLVEAEAS